MSDGTMSNAFQALFEEVDVVRGKLTQSCDAWLKVGNTIKPGFFRGGPDKTCACALGTLSAFDHYRGVEHDELAAVTLGIKRANVRAFAFGFDGGFQGRSYTPDEREWFKLGEEFRAKYVEAAA